MNLNNQIEGNITVEGIKEVIAEASRCLNCKNPSCKQGCPIQNDIPEFIRAVAQGDFGEAKRVVARKSNLPAVCGRVCAHEIQCEGHCVLAKAGKAIRIGMIEKTIADFGFQMELPFSNIVQKTQGRVAIIGSGPAGLTVAGDLAKIGFSVTVFEALPEAGGILLYGIPSFRLSKKVVRREIQNIEAQGVRFETNCIVGQDTTVDRLFEQGFEAIFIGSGTAIAKDLDIPGQELNGIIQSNYLLRTYYLFRSKQLPLEEVLIHKGDEVFVIGAGNVGMDAVRTALRLGAQKATIIHRGDEGTLPALESEHLAAEKEGAIFMYNTSPLEYVGENGNITGIKVRNSKGETMLFKANKILLAVGSRPAKRIISTSEGIEVDSGGFVIIKERPYGMTTRKGVFAGGDVVHRPASVVMAMREAKKVAEGISDYINAIHLLDL